MWHSQNIVYGRGNNFKVFQGKHTILMSFACSPNYMVYTLLVSFDLVRGSYFCLNFILWKEVQADWLERRLYHLFSKSVRLEENRQAWKRFADFFVRSCLFFCGGIQIWFGRRYTATVVEPISICKGHFSRKKSFLFQVFPIFLHAKLFRYFWKTDPCMFKDIFVENWKIEPMFKDLLLKRMAH